MPLLLTGVLPFLGHNHSSAVAFLTCRHHNFHASIIPEFLSDEERVRKFYQTRQQNQLEVDKQKQYTNLYDLFVQIPLMQFSPSLVLHQEECVDSILKPLLETKYFTRSLQRCSFGSEVEINNDLLQALSKVQSLTKLDLELVESEHLEIIINSFPSLEALSFDASCLSESTINIHQSSSPPATTKTLRSLTMRGEDGSFATQFVPNFPNLRKLVLSNQFFDDHFDHLDLHSLTSSLPLLSDLQCRECYYLKNIESLKNLTHLSSLQFERCYIPDFSFRALENALSQLTTLFIDRCDGFSESSPVYPSLSNAQNLTVLKLKFGRRNPSFNNDCLQYLQNMVHLRKLDLSHSKITGDSQLLKTLMQNLTQLEELNFERCRIGGQDAIAGALYNTAHSRLGVLNLSNCDLVDDDLKGIGALKNTLEELDLGGNDKLTNESLLHCKDLAKLKVLNFCWNVEVVDLSPLKDCLNLEEISFEYCHGLTDDSFKVFSEEPNSFPNLRVLTLSRCDNLTEKVFEHLSKNNHLVCQLKKLNLEGSFDLVSSSPTALNDLCQLKGLRHLLGILSDADSELERNRLKVELMRSLKNLEEIQ